jgi:putative hydrolase of the HAD superfamily
MEAVLFDLDDTLCRYRRSGRTVLATAFEILGIDPFFAIEDYYAVFDEHAETADTMAGQREACFEALAAAADRDPAVGRAVAEAYDAEQDHRNVDFLDGAPTVIEALGPDQPLGLVTNGAPGMQSTKLDALGISDAFETIVFAGYDTPPKPSPASFHTALTELDVAPDRAVHIGNSPESDVAGAQAAGLGAVWLGPDDASVVEPAPDYTVATLAALTDPPWASR